MRLILTNNPMAYDNFKNKHIEYLEHGSYLETLKKARDYVHAGAVLLTHPLTSSLKPNETPYKTILLDRKEGKVDFDSLELIENAVSSAEKFLADRPRRAWPEKILADFQLIDYDIIKDSVNLYERG